MQKQEHFYQHKTDVMSSVAKYLLLTILLLITALQPAHAERKKKILVLHSYHQGLEWTDNITQGIQQVFFPFQTRYEVYYEYLDSKRNAGQDYLNQIVQFINLKNNNIQYELIIAVDNNALDMLNQKKVHFQGDPPVIFAGVNNYKPELTANLKSVAGVVETTDHRGTIALMRKLHPDSDDITVIIDQTPTGKQIRDDLRKVEREFQDITFHYLRDFLLSDIPDIAARFREDELLYILTFNRDSADNFISYTEGIEMLARHTHAPIYGSWDFYLNKGIVGGKITSGVLQGKTVGEMALRILKGEKPNRIGILHESPTQFMFDYTYVDKHQLDEELLPAASVVFNKPPSWFERNKTILLEVFVLLFIAALIILYSNTRKQNRLQAKYAIHLEEEVKLRTEKLREANLKLQRLSDADGLTHLYNRRYFDAQLDKDLRHHQRSELPLTLMMCDIDYFKNYNDSYGHIAGDKCIKQVARLLQKQCTRASDTVARYGGEEFAIILPATNSTDAGLIAAKICKQIFEVAIPHNSSQISDRVTISIGVAAIVPGIDTKPVDIIALADKALYTSKHQGRNQFNLLES
ncbi:diguanylate cyclase [Vibrio sp. JC009]|uniref:ABC transporter substrate binding protein n=1 Tax=Vibrio sp. JC009 TaxID=2912314 RepID=UPI0023AEB3B9|nr:ABC transporter substrate binding protein [Vibrio sp. JC009]WED21050.1 diguanylate cyclase [Vibrio sp. JC009]